MTSSMVLDNLERIKTIDKNNMCGVQEKQPEACEDAVKRARELKIPQEIRISKRITIRYRKPENVIVVGMGGSAIGGNLLKDWLREEIPVPIEVCRDYHLPAYATQKTLVLAVSYSGNTEEALSGFLEAVKRGCMTIAIGSNGVLQEFSERLGTPFIKLPEGIPPRSAIPYLFFPLVVALERLGIIREKEGEIEEAIDILKKIRNEVKPQNHIPKNLAKMLALQIEGSIPVIYGFRLYEAVALRIKTQFNENSKIPSKCEFFPELGHNEVVGWEAPEKFTKNFTVIILRDGEEAPEIKTRIEVTKKLILEKKAKRVLEIYARGRSKLAKILSILYIGDFVSIYLAILQGIDPTPIDTVTEAKRELEKRLNTLKKLREDLEKLTGF